MKGPKHSFLFFLLFFLFIYVFSPYLIPSHHIVYCISQSLFSHIAPAPPLLVLLDAVAAHLCRRRRCLCRPSPMPPPHPNPHSLQGAALTPVVALGPPRPAPSHPLRRATQDARPPFPHAPPCCQWQIRPPHTGVHRCQMGAGRSLIFWLHPTQLACESGFSRDPREEHLKETMCGKGSRKTALEGASNLMA